MRGEGQLITDRAFYIDSNGVRLHAAVRGYANSRGIIVYVQGGPGIPLARAMRAPALSLLECDSTVLYFDQRGAGKSRYPLLSATVELNTVVDDVLTVLRYARKRWPKKELMLLGCSYGGFLAISAALREPSLMDKLAVCCPAIHFTDEDRALTGMGFIDLIPPVFRGRCARAFERISREHPEYDGFERIMAIMQLKSFRTFLRLMPPALVTVPKYHCAIGHWFYKETFEGRIEGLSVPTLVLHGEDDSIISCAGVMRGLKRASNPLVTALVYEDCTHSIFSDAPERAYRDISRFMCNERLRGL